MNYNKWKQKYEQLQQPANNRNQPHIDQPVHKHFFIFL